MIDPQMVDAMRTSWVSVTSSLLLPTKSHTHAHTSSVAPIPTVIPPKDTPPTIEAIGDAGQKTLWVVFVVMFISTLVLAFLTYRTPVQKRLFHILTTFITALATLSYFAMATGSGNSFTEFIIRESHKHGIPDTIELPRY